MDYTHKKQNQRHLVRVDKHENGNHKRRYPKTGYRADNGCDYDNGDYEYNLH